MLEKLFVEFFIGFLIENRTVILFGLGALGYSALEYYLGEGDHGSLIGFLKHIMKKKDETKL